MAMINMDVIGIIYSIYEDLLEKVLLTNIPKDCPNLNEIKGNYLKYLINTYQSLRPTITKQEVIDLITSQQKELWADALPYDKYRKFVQDKCFDSLVKISTLSFRLADISRIYPIMQISKEKRDNALKGLEESSKHVKPCFREYADEFALEGYKDIMYASGDRQEISERLRITIEQEDEKGYN